MNPFGNKMYMKKQRDKKEINYLQLTVGGHFVIPKAGQSPTGPKSTTHSQVEYETCNMFFSWSM